LIRSTVPAEWDVLRRIDRYIFQNYYLIEDKTVMKTSSRLNLRLFKKDEIEKRVHYVLKVWASTISVIEMSWRCPAGTTTRRIALPLSKIPSV
jgi:ABC-type ATPase involved in cell division